MRIRKVAIVSSLFLSFAFLFITDAITVVKDDQPNQNLRTVKTPKYAPDELIVKFKSNEGNKVLQSLAEGKGIAAMPFSASLSKLNAKYKANGIDRVFKFPRIKDGTGHARFATSEENAQRVKARFPLRTKRAPQGAALPDVTNVFIIKFAQGTDILKLQREYAGDPDVVYAQPNYTCRTYDIPPDDPYYSSSESWGQTYDDLWGLKAIMCEDAWQSFESENDIGAGVVVAVVDTGVAYSHPDLAANIWNNTGEIPANNIDDDDNGYVDDWRGWNFYADNNNPLDGCGHGSHCSGTIAAVTDNGIGVAGISWHSKIMPVKALSDDGGGYVFDLAAAICYAADNGADVISNSWGPGYRHPSDPVAEEAVQYAYGLGAVVVFAAGNSNDDVAYYSPNNMEEVVAVAATTQDDVKCSFSNWGDKIDVSAPGGGYSNELGSGSCDIYNILSALPDGSILSSSCNGSLKVSDGYYRLAGTSMACPHVAGLAALLISAQPGWTNTTIMAHIRLTSDNIDGLNSGYEGMLGSGRINAYSALTSPLPTTPNMSVESFSINDSSGNGDGVVDPGEGIDLRVFLRNVGAAAQNVSAELTTEDPAVTISMGEASFAEIGYGELAEANYRFFVAESFPSNRDLVFELAITYTNGQEEEEIVVPGQWTSKYVNWENTTGPWDGTQEHPYQNIQAAIDNSPQSLTKIYVAMGTYNENVVMQKYIHLYGGYNPADWSRDIQANVTVIDGGGNGSVVKFDSMGEASSSLSGFTIRNGSGTAFAGSCGGGIYCYGSSPIIRNNIITNNLADNGGAICCICSSPTLVENMVISNSADFEGGGICCYLNSSLSLSGNTISDNSAGDDGGGISCLYNSSIESTTNLITNNSAENYFGGGISCWLSSSLNSTNDIIADNSAGLGGGGIDYETNCFSTLTNVTIVQNSAAVQGGGINCFEYGDVAIKNSIIWANNAASGSQILRDYILPTTLTIAYCDIQGGWNGEGNINVDPLFVGGNPFDYHLQFDSPCIDEGTWIQGVPETDMDGNPRPLDIAGVGNDATGDEYDIGADEYSSPPDITDIIWDDGSTPQGDVAITWDSQTGVTYDVYYADAFAGTYTDVADVMATGSSTTWTDDGSQTGSHPSTVGDRYYKVACHGTSSYAEYIVGMYKLVMGYQVSADAYSAASSPLIPYYSGSAPDINDIIGDQGHSDSQRDYADKIWKYDSASQSFDKYCWNHNGTWEGYPVGTDTTLDPDIGFAFLYQNSERDENQNIYVVGKAARGDECQNEIMGKGGSASKNSYVGYNYVDEESLANSHILEDGFTGSAMRTFSDKVWLFDFITQSFSGYAWYDTADWQYYNTSAFDLTPGEAYLINNKNEASDWTWTVTNPAGY